MMRTPKGGDVYEGMKAEREVFICFSESPDCPCVTGRMYWKKNREYAGKFCEHADPEVMATSLMDQGFTYHGDLFGAFLGLD